MEGRVREGVKGREKRKDGRMIYLKVEERVKW